MKYVLVGVLFSAQAFAFDFNGHWNDQNGQLTCENGYNTTCEFNQYIIYGNLSYRSEFKLTSYISCNAMNGLSFDISVSNAEISRYQNIYLKDDSMECGSIQNDSISIDCEGYILRRYSNYGAVQFDGVPYSMTLDSNGKLNSVIPIKIYNVKCDLTAKMDSVFP